MRQRVSIALATVCRPDFIIADEPTTALDVVVQKDVLTMIRETQREFGSSMIFVTHDLTVHANIADRLGIMYAGRLVEEAPTAELFANPLHPYTAHLVASLPRIGDARARSRRCPARRPTSPIRRRAAASIRAARSRWTSAGTRFRRSPGWRRIIASPALPPAPTCTRPGRRRRGRPRPSRRGAHDRDFSRSAI